MSRFSVESLPSTSTRLLSTSSCLFSCASISSRLDTITTNFHLSVQPAQGTRYSRLVGNVLSHRFDRVSHRLQKRSRRIFLMLNQAYSSIRAQVRLRRDTVRQQLLLAPGSSANPNTGVCVTDLVCQLVSSTGAHPPSSLCTKLQRLCIPSARKHVRAAPDFRR